MDNISLILNGKPFIITNLRSLTKFKDDIYKILVLNHQYKVRSNVSEDIFQSFINYIDKEEIPDIKKDNFHEYALLNDEFKILSEILEEKQKELGDEICYIYLLLRNQDNDNSYNELYEKLISKNLDYYLQEYDDEMS